MASGASRLSFQRASLCLAMVLFAVGTAHAATEAESEGAFVFTRPQTSSYWHTATNSVLALPVAFPNGATSATLTVSGLKYSATYANITASPFLLALPAATSPETENVYDLTLAFNDAGATVRTARIGLIDGYDTTAEGGTRCLAPKEQRKWGWVRKSRAVFPIPYGMTSFTIGGVVTDTRLGGDQGWYALDVPGDRTIPLTLDELSATLFGLPEATTFFVR